MNFIRNFAMRSVLTGLFVFLLSSLNAQDGKAIFQANCASCHSLDKDLTGPALRGVEGRGPWSDREQLVKWVHNPGAYKSAYTDALKASRGTIMPSFSLPDAEINAIFDFIKTAPDASAGKSTTPGGNTTTNDNPGEDSSLIFGIISIALAIIALILMQVNSSLKKLSDDKEGIQRPEAVPFWKNKIYIALIALVLFMVGGYFVAKSAIGLGRQQGYQPTQPILYSHKVHAGINQINCLYCHGGAMESKHAGIPTLNICMNCHKAINSYSGPQIYDRDGNAVDGTAEIQKLYKYAGFTTGQAWDPAKATSPQWVKIHNLPDHVYFNHAQHVKAGNVQCQTCHGNIQEMDVVQQKAELSMGWCINCHRQTKVNFNMTDSTGNKFYSIYEKFHNDIKNHKMDSVTVKDIGGTECQKCHY